MSKKQPSDKGQINTIKTGLTVIRTAYDSIEIRACRNGHCERTHEIPIANIAPDYFEGLLRVIIKDLILREHSAEIEDFVIRGREMINKEIKSNEQKT